MNSDLEDIYQRHLDLWKSHERDYGLRTFVIGAMKEYAELKIKQLQKQQPDEYYQCNTDKNEPYNKLARIGRKRHALLRLLREKSQLQT